MSKMVVRWALPFCLLAPSPGMAAVYECRSETGKPAFVAHPDGYRDCRRVDLQVDEPNPNDVARALEEKRRKDEEARGAEERAREERLIRAREAEAQAQMRRARAAEEELRLLKQREVQPQSPPTLNVPIWPIPVPVPAWPHPHPHPPHPDPQPRRGGMEGEHDRPPPFLPQTPRGRSR